MIIESIAVAFCAFIIRLLIHLNYTDILDFVIIFLTLLTIFLFDFVSRKSSQNAKNEADGKWKSVNDSLEKNHSDEKTALQEIITALKSANKALDANNTVLTNHNQVLEANNKAAIKALEDKITALKLQNAEAIKDLEDTVEDLEFQISDNRDEKENMFSFCSWMIRNSSVPNALKKVNIIQMFLNIKTLFRNASSLQKVMDKVMAEKLQKVMDEILQNVMAFNSLPESDKNIIDGISFVKPLKQISIPGGGQIDIHEGLYDNRPVCLKIFPLSRKKIADNEELVATNVHHNTDSDNIIRYIGKDFSDNGDVILIMDLMKGNLKDYILHEQKTSDDVRSVIIQIIQGVYDLHRLNYHHTAINLENILYKKTDDGRINIKLAFLDMCKSVPKDSSAEICNLRGLGEVLFLLVTNKTETQFDVNIFDDYLKKFENKPIKDNQYNLPGIAFDLIKGLVLPSLPTPSWAEILQHPINWSDNTIASYVHYSYEKIDKKRRHTFEVDQCGPKKYRTEYEVPVFVDNQDMKNVIGDNGWGVKIKNQGIKDVTYQSMEFIGKITFDRNRIVHCSELGPKVLVNSLVAPYPNYMPVLIALMVELEFHADVIKCLPIKIISLE